jgi:8-oxo-dGTP diphosphatase
MKLVLCVAAALIDPDNRVLIQKRPPNKPFAGFWEFPGGKIEAGETPEQALVRELDEELGLLTIEKALFPLSFISYTRSDEHVLIPLFGIRNWTNQPVPKIGQELAWVRPNRIGDYPLLESNRAVLSTLIQLI